ncbi:protein-tyrosine phosphatase family protein [Cytobacillus kochii]|uniref:protein-tyrosine phosphatase family protein n=1 Tax=Cytobacillus kochii TaxID=859143 RepID=UPI0025A2DEB0|nr:dual specificity protein phosphatase family protein [Cytobacillus kochii]MDM5205399.1 dual specificity protein phosphatase family protein [Cytobacillus kochii]
MDKNYHELIPNRIYIGGANAAVDAVKAQGIDVVYDLRAEATEEEANSKRIHAPIVDDAENQDQSVQAAIAKVKEAFDEGKKIYFHCAGGRNRTGTVAIGLLLELGVAMSIEEAELMVQEIRSEISVRPEMKETLKRLYK